MQIKKMRPKVTILLPVYNGERYLAETLASLFQQTYTDFELLIIDDGSTDSSADIIKSFDDPRIRVLKNPERLKLSGALNRGMREAKGKYIARMDADDIALPLRLQRQIEYMEEHPTIGMCGTAIEIFGAGKPRKDVYLATADAIRAYALFDCPFCHPSVMMRRGMFLQYDLWYDGAYYPTEDYELWARAVDKFPTANIDEVLLRYRVHGESMTGSDWDRMDKQAARIIKERLERLGISCTDEEVLFHRSIGRGRSCVVSAYSDLSRAEEWLLEFRDRVQLSKEDMNRTIALVWYRLCLNNTRLGLQVLRQYMSGRLGQADPQRKIRGLFLLLSIAKQKMQQRPRGGS